MSDPNWDHVPLDFSTTAILVPDPMTTRVPSLLISTSRPNSSVALAPVNVADAVVDHAPLTFSYMTTSPVLLFAYLFAIARTFPLPDTASLVVEEYDVDRENEYPAFVVMVCLLYTFGLTATMSPSVDDDILDT